MHVKPTLSWEVPSNHSYSGTYSLNDAYCSDLELLLAVPDNVAKKPLGICLSWPQTLNCSQKMPTFIHWENSNLQRESYSLKTFILRGLEIQNQIYFQKMCISLAWTWCFLNHSAREDNKYRARTEPTEAWDAQEMRCAWLILVGPLCKYVSQNAVILNEGN